MKLTWFGGTTIRIHIGGAILVADAGEVPGGIDRAELVSGADRVFETGGQGLTGIDASAWKPRRAGRPIDDGGALEAVEVWKVGDGAVLVDAVGEPPLLLVSGQLPRLGRRAGDAVVVLFGDGAAMSGLGEALLDVAPPRLIALAGPEEAVDFAITTLREHLDGTGLVSLEAGLALEV
jgi:hypothetical protein